MSDSGFKLALMEKLVALANPLVRGLLRSPLHSVVSKDILLLNHLGRKSGREYPTPVSYIRDGDTLRVCTSAPWWKNLRDRPDVTVVLKGKLQRVRATVCTDDSERIGAAITELLNDVPRDAPFYRIRLGDGGVPNPEDVARAAGEAILVELELR